MNYLKRKVYKTRKVYLENDANFATFENRNNFIFL